MTRPTLVLFSNDLRVSDNRALATAAAQGTPIICCLVLDESGSGARAPGAARRWWLHHSIAALAAALDKAGAKLILRRGPVVDTALTVAKEIDADRIFWNRHYEPAQVEIGAELKRRARSKWLIAESFDGQLLHEPSLLKNGSGGPYRVFGAFRRALLSQPEPRDPVDTPHSISGWNGPVQTEHLEDWDLLPQKPDWASELRTEWRPGEQGASEMLDDFIDSGLAGYAEGRDFPARSLGSRLSPHLAHGEITPFQIFARLRRAAADTDTEKFRSELIWREFCHHLHFHNPALATQNYDPRFNAMEWLNRPEDFARWSKGLTGYPIVDAGMRQLWRTGFMHNRVRMIVASFLTKHLQTDWRHGEQWFWDTLVDADAANNPANWQWVAGSGADAAPYFRIFNPILQGEKFDPDGDYVRRYVPELGKLGKKHIHCPWTAPPEALANAGLTLDTTYPSPIADHQLARQRALAAFDTVKGLR